MSAQSLTLLVLLVSGCSAWFGEQRPNAPPAFGNSFDGRPQAPVPPQQPGQGGQRSLLAFIPQHIQAFLPFHVRQELSTLTLQDAIVARNLLWRLPQFTSIQEVRDTLHERSPRLEALAHQKAAHVRAFVAARHAALKPDTQEFFNQAGELGKQYGHSFVQLVDQQTPETKHDLDFNFPIVSHILNSPAGLALSNHLRGLN
ncbi:Fatty-acid and retinol-binding protein 8 [Aphelenchoides fujianensis]|nr:Fatty-acid and retinol-binding protein 8 [Aphelenchoides fujianensis]